MLMVCAGWLGDSFLGKGVLKVLASQAHHEGPAGSELPCTNRRPAARHGNVDGLHKPDVVAMYYLFKFLLSMRLLWRRRCCCGVGEEWGNE